MRRFKKIIVVADPLGHSGATLDRAAELASENKAELTIVSVSRDTGTAPAYIRKAVQREQRKELQLIARAVRANGARTRSALLTGIPFIEIIREVVRGKYDLLMKPAEGRGGMSRLLFGSTDLNLLRQCPSPVWIIKPSKRRKHARVLAAVDPDPSIKTHAALNRLILDLAISLAVREDTELHIVHAWDVPEQKLLRRALHRGSPPDLSRLVRETRKTHKQWLDRLLKEYDLSDIPARVHLLKGDPGRVIPKLAKKERVELVVMGTVARTGIPGFIIGNTAEKMLAALDCSVLAVKPKGFKTPVRV